MSFQPPRFNERDFSEMEAANLNLNAFIDMYQRVHTRCFDKCCRTEGQKSGYSDGLLSTNEKTCAERCAAKYVEVTLRVSKRIMQTTQQQQY